MVVIKLFYSFKKYRYKKSLTIQLFSLFDIDICIISSTGTEGLSQDFKNARLKQ